MSNRRVLAKFIGLSRTTNQSKRPQRSVVTEHDQKGLTKVRVRSQGRVPEVAKAVTAVAATDLFTSAAHGYVAGNAVIFPAPLTGGAGITPGLTYFVIASGLTANDFKVSTTVGGATIDVTSDLTVGTVRRMVPEMIGAHSTTGKDYPNIPGPRQ